MQAMTDAAAGRIARIARSSARRAISSMPGFEALRSCIARMPVNQLVRMG